MRALIISVFVLIVGFLLVDTIGGSDIPPVTGWVAGRLYEPARSYYDDEGDHHYEPEKWIVVVNLPHDAVSIETKSNVWNRAVDGAMVRVTGRKGWLSGSIYGYRIINISGGGDSSGAGSSAGF